MKLGILGTGKIVREVLPLIASLDYEERWLLATPRSLERAQNMCETYGLNGYYTDYEQLLASDIDTVYVALPNHLHFEYARRALASGKNVFLEKPAVTSSGEFEELMQLASEKDLVFAEAISLHYTPAYRAVREALPSLGDVKLVHFQYCQYSSRYDDFMKGIIAPAFDPAAMGGALMDINVYNVHAIVGLFGAPDSCIYYPNMDCGIDTSGTLIMQYPGFIAIAEGAKDTQATNRSQIEGTKTCLEIPMPMNAISAYALYDTKGNLISSHDFHRDAHRLQDEFEEFNRMVRDHDTAVAAALCETSLAVIRILEEMRPY